MLSLTFDARRLWCDLHAALHGLDALDGTGGRGRMFVLATGAHTARTTGRLLRSTVDQWVSAHLYPQATSKQVGQQVSWHS